MAVVFEPAAGYSLADLAGLFNRSFEGYVGGETRFDESSLARFLAGQGVDLGISLVASEQDRPLGLALLARHGWTCRLAAMGIVAGRQGQGFGHSLMEAVLREASARGEKSCELEVIEQNPAGVGLYRKLGFVAVQRLLSLECERPAGVPHPGLAEIDIAEAAAEVVRHGPPDLPWQVSGFNLVTLGPPLTAFRLGPACAILSDPRRETVRIHALVVALEARSRGQGRCLLQALFDRFPGRRWGVPALCPELQAPFYRALGFRDGPLSQVQMRRSLG